MVPRVDDILAAPVGVALLDRLELGARERFLPFVPLTDSDPVAVEQAAAALDTTSLGTLLHVVLDAASLVGPWTGGAADSLASCYELAPRRRRLAEALWQRFGGELVGPASPEHQEHWLDAHDAASSIEPAFVDLSRVYGNGEFTWSGLWTTSTPPSEIHDDLVAAWEFEASPVARWRLPVRAGVRVWNIDHPEDWRGLVEAFPMQAKGPHWDWELPGPNQHRSDVARLAAVVGQRAVRTSANRHVLPDWTAVADAYDGVHLSWAGVLTAEGFISDLPGGGVTMLRYWSSERTLWLRDVFGEPEPLEAPALSGRVSGLRGIDVTRGHERRADLDRAAIARRLQRPIGPSLPPSS